MDIPYIAASPLAPEPAFAKAHKQMADPIDSIQEQVPADRDADGPPLERWHPPLSGDIDIRIDQEGRWFHEGAPIRREALVRLFASILRREEDGQYYLVTPVEKWRIQVDLHPLQVTDVEAVATGEGATLLRATLNTGRIVEIGEDYPLAREPAAADAAVLRLDHGLSALFSRPAWYRLVDLAEGDEALIRSVDYTFALSPEP